MQFFLNPKKKLKKIFERSIQYFRGPSSDYDTWIKNHEKQSKIKKIYQKHLSYTPKISVIMPVWNTDERWLNLAIQSVINQYYHNWELCIADGHSTDPRIRKILKDYSRKDRRIRTTFLPENKGIAGNTNEALSLADGSYVTFLDHDDELPPACLFEIVNLLNENKNYDIIYTDNDKIDENGTRSDPFFKFDFSLPALLSTNYPFHLFLCRKSLVDNVGGFRYGYDGAQDYDLILRVVERTTPEKIAHIDKILYHWRMIRESSAHSSAAKPYAYSAGKAVLEDYLVRNDIRGVVEELEPGSYHVKKECLRNQKIIIVIISSGNKNDPFIKDLHCFLQKTTYPVKKKLIPDIYKNDITGPDIQFFDNKSKDCFFTKILKTENPDNVIFISDEWNFGESFHANPRWIEALTEHFSFDKVGIIGTGSLVFPNIICNVERPCGPVFCGRQEIIDTFFKQLPAELSYDELQIQLSDFSRQMNYSNIFTPFCIGNNPQYQKVSQYYKNFNKRSHFTKNMEFYLPDSVVSKNRENYMYWRKK